MSVALVKPSCAAIWEAAGRRVPGGVWLAGRPAECCRPRRRRDRRPSHGQGSGRPVGQAHAPDPVRERIRQTRIDGYAVNPGLVVEGHRGMAAAVFDHAGQPAWSLTPTGAETRFRPERGPEIGALLPREAHTLGRMLTVASTPGADRQAEGGRAKACAGLVVSGFKTREVRRRCGRPQLRSLVDGWYWKPGCCRRQL